MKQLNRKGQGMVEYILIVGAVLMLVMAFAWDKIYNATTHTGIITDLLSTLWTTKPAQYGGGPGEVPKAAGNIHNVQP